MQIGTWGKLSAKLGAAALCAGLALPTSAEPLPPSVAGAWRITRVLPTTNVGCWSAEQARDLVGSTLVYSASSMRWHGGEVPLEGISTRELSAAQFQKENSGSGGAVNFTQLGIRSARVLEVDLQHEDMDITGASTEVPGDSVLVVAPGRIVVSACGVYLEAVRSSNGGNLLRSSARR
jgi:hypothetical protein